MSEEKKEIVVVVDSRLEKLISKFIGYQRTDFAAVKIAFDQRDYEELQRLGHRIKGACGGYGFYELGQLANQLETAAGLQDLAAIQKCIGSMQDQLFHSKIQFEKK